MLKKYSQYPLCAEILEDLTQLLLMHSFDLTRLVYSEDIRLFDDPKSLFVGLAVVQCLQVLSSLMTVTRSSVFFYKMTWSLFCANTRVLTRFKLGQSFSSSIELMIDFNDINDINDINHR